MISLFIPPVTRRPFDLQDGGIRVVVNVESPVLVHRPMIEDGDVELDLGCLLHPVDLLRSPNALVFTVT